MSSTGLRRVLAAAAITACLPGSIDAAAIRAKAEIACQPTAEALTYDCTVRLTNSRTNEPLTGIDLSVGADMPAMPMMHNVRPVKATAGQEKGTYQARIRLEMHGEWALALNLSGKVRDRVVKVLRFEHGQAAREIPPTGRPPARHRH